MTQRGAASDFKKRWSNTEDAEDAEDASNNVVWGIGGKKGGSLRDRDSIRVGETEKIKDRQRERDRASSAKERKMSLRDRFRAPERGRGEPRRRERPPTSRPPGTPTSVLSLRDKGEARPPPARPRVMRRGRINGFEGKMRDGMTNGRGMTNGLVKRYVHGFTNGTGLINGQIRKNNKFTGFVNGRGLVNGLVMEGGKRRELNINTVRRRQRLRWLGAVITLILLALIPLSAVMYTLPPGPEIMIDGKFDDWKGIKKYQDGMEHYLGTGRGDIREYAVLEEENFLDLYVATYGPVFNGTLIQDRARGIVGLEDKVQIFISTGEGGYPIGGIEADHMVEIGGCNGKVYDAYLHRYQGSGGWNWTRVKGIEASASTRAVECQVWLNDLASYEGDLGHGKVETHVRYQYSQGPEDEGIIPYAPGGSALFEVTPRPHPQAMHGFPHMLDIDIYSSTLFSLESLTLRSCGDIKDFGPLYLYSDNGDGVYDAGDNLVAGSSYQEGYRFDIDVAVLKSELDKDRLTSTKLYAAGEIAPGSSGSVGLSLEDVEVTGVGNVYGDLSRPMMIGYAGGIPDRIIIDGLFADWYNNTGAVFVNDTVDDVAGLDNENVDLVRYGSSQDEKTVAFYAEMAEGSHVLKGRYIPYKKEYAREPIKDSDGDGIADDYDDHPNDFDNDGIPDTRDPDIDGDGVPNEEDLEPRNPRITTHVPVRRELEFLGRDTVAALINSDGSAATGYGHRGADHMLEVKGKDGRVITSTLYRFLGSSPQEWNWGYPGEAEARASGSRLEFGTALSALDMEEGASYYIIAHDWGNGSVDGSRRTLLPGALRSTRLSLTTITIDGNFGDWSGVLSDPDNVMSDGTEGIDDLDEPRTEDRDLTEFAFTWDGTYLYFYFRRTTGGNRQLSFLVYLDLDFDGLMESTDRVVRFPTAGGEWDSYDHSYIPANAGGDELTGDGENMPGGIGTGTDHETGMEGVGDEGIRIETRIAWSALGIPAGSPIYMHASSALGDGTDLPDQVEDNVAPTTTHYAEVDVEPDHTGYGIEGETKVYTHTVRNNGNEGDTVDITASSDHGWTVELYESDGTTLLSDSDGDGVPDTGNLSSGASSEIKVKVHIPTDLSDTVEDVTTVTGISSWDETVTDSARDTTMVGALIIAPDRSKNAVPGNWVEYHHTIVNNAASSDTIELSHTSGQGWDVYFYESDGTTRLTDTDGDGNVDTGPIPGGGEKDIVVKVVVPSSASVGTQDVTTIEATSDNDPGTSDTATDTTTIKERIEIVPDHEKSSGAGKVVTYSHTVYNNWNRSDVINLEASSSQGWTVELYESDGTTLLSDSDGDGVPDTGELEGNGTSVDIKVKLYIPAEVSPGTVDTATVVATSSGDTSSVDSAVDTTTVQILATYADSLHTDPSDRFSLLDTVYAEGTGLSEDDEVYFTWFDPDGVTVKTSSHITVDAKGEVDDSYALQSTDKLGTWTVILYDAGSAAEIARHYFEVVAPNVTISKTGSTTTACPEEEYDYIIAAENAGQGTAYNLVINETLDPNLAYVSDSITADGESHSGREHSWSFDELGPGESLQFTLTVRVVSDALAGTEIPNKAFCYYEDEHAVFQNITNDSADNVTVQQVADLSLDPTSNSTQSLTGKWVAYYHTVTNEGNGPDRFEINATSSNGWSVEVYEGDNTTELSDVDGDGLPETETIGPGENYTFVVKVYVPSGTPYGTTDDLTVMVESDFETSVHDSALDTTTAIPELHDYAAALFSVFLLALIMHRRKRRSICRQ